jgi:CBS domain-containing protein
MVTDLVTAKEDVSIEKAVRMLHTRHVGSIIVTDSEKSGGSENPFEDSLEESDDKKGCDYS